MTVSPRLDHLETPAALVDIPRMDANFRRVADYTRRHGLDWRPHAKTHKTPELAVLQIGAGAVGVTVATPREAEIMAPAVDDILLAYPPFGASKLQRLLDLPERVRLSVALDSPEALRGLARAANSRDRRIGVLVELDMGMGRLGVQEPAQAVALAREAAESAGVDYRGVMFYPGQLRGPLEEDDPRLRELSARLERFRAALDEAGLAPAVVSGGSTPALWVSHLIRGLTEVRPGTNIFNDRATALIGACAWEDCAYTVLATVVSTAVPGQAVVDAGSKVLAKEELRAEGGGFGALLDRPEVVVKGLSEEHGILDLARTEWRPRVGDRVRIVPNHVCVSVNLQERLWGTRDGEIVEEWTVAGRGRSPARL